jgi:ssDNA thymidine ADP-ribosyltransferase, DarT/Calcineurin-like phosphoesterase
MLICAAGNIHGAMDRLYQDVLAFEASLGVCFDYVLHVGDFGIWPDPNRIDKATRHHDGVGDFPSWLRESRRAPRPTLFIKGNHEDLVWLDARQDAEVLPGLQARDFQRDPDDPGKFERYQAEALVHRHLPVAALNGIVCHGPTQQAHLGQLATGLRLNITIASRPNWYF